jgi:hypothetical protein
LGWGDPDGFLPVLLAALKAAEETHSQPCTYSVHNIIEGP